MPLPNGVAVGHIYSHSHYYLDSNGEWQRKHLLILGCTLGNDVVFRLLTSAGAKSHVCYHGDPYPGYFLGHLGGVLTANSWVDLRKQDDYDDLAFVQHLACGKLTHIHTLSQPVLCSVLACAAGAEDTAGYQAQVMLNQRAALGCP